MPQDNPTPETTLVIILGASSWPKSPDLASSEAFQKSARELKEYFLDPGLFSLPKENLLDLFDSEKAPSDLDEEICNFLENRQYAIKEKNKSIKDIVVYYVGHGGFTGHNNEYFLAVRATRKDNPLISGVPIDGLAKTLKEKVRGLRKYIILDACFSASAYETFQSAPMEVAKIKTQEAFRKGTALLCSSGAKDPSKLLSDEKYTMFTGALLQVLREGSRKKQDKLNFAQVGEMVKDLILDKYQDEAVRPQIMAPSQEQGDICILPFFPNPALQKKELLEKINKLEDIVIIHNSEISNIKAELQKLNERIDIVQKKSENVSANKNENEKQEYEKKEYYQKQKYRYGLTKKQWDMLPEFIKFEIKQYGKERIVGIVWLTICVFFCYIMVLFPFPFDLTNNLIFGAIVAFFSIYSIFGIKRTQTGYHFSKSEWDKQEGVWNDWHIVVKAKNRNTF